MEENTFRALLSSRLNVMENVQFMGMKPPKAELIELRKFCQSNRTLFCSITEDGEVYQSAFDTSTTWESSPYSSSMAFENLSRITIADTRINIPAKGSYLLLRTVEEPYILNGITTIVEDHTGEVSLFTAYNFVSSGFKRFPGHILPVGTIFILKEPYLKVDRVRGTAVVQLQTESPSDIIILSDNHRLFDIALDVKWKNEVPMARPKAPSSAEEGKKQGNNYYLKKNFYSALNLYLRAVQLLKPTEEQLMVYLYLNISATCLVLNYFEKALEYASKALEVEPHNLKGLYRAGRAHYELQQFKESKGFFRKLLSVQSAHQEGKEMLKKTFKRLKEMSGEVSVEEIYFASKLSPNTAIDCADFVGPLKVVSRGKGRRAVEATENIKPGTLIAVSKAFYLGSSESNLPSCIDHKGVIKNGKFEQAVHEICQLIYKNPKVFGTMLYSLPTKDEILDANVPKPFCDDACEEPFVDVERIRRILFTNFISVKETGQSMKMVLVNFLSYMNHSCLANANRSIYNNVMVVHAIKHIKAGEEVTVSYFQPVTSYSQRQMEFHTCEMSCNCRICESEQRIPASVRCKIDDIITEVVNHTVMIEHLRGTSGLPFYLGMMKTCIAELEQLTTATVPKEIKNMYCLSVPYFVLSVAYSRLDQIQNAIDVLWKAISILGFDTESINAWAKGNKDFSLPEDCLFTDTILEQLEFLVDYHFRLQQFAEFSKYKRALETGWAIYAGDTKKMVLDRHTKKRASY